MDYGKLFTRAWNIVWANLWLILLGILAGFTGSSGSSGTNYQMSESDVTNAFDKLPFSQNFQALSGIMISLIIGIICFGLIVGIIFYLLSQVATGGLVAGVNSIEEGESATLRSSWVAGWHRKWTLAGIGLVLVIPVILVILISLVIGISVFGAATVTNASSITSGDFSPFAGVAMSGLVVLSLAFCCLLIPFFIFFGVWIELAYRACMLEGLGVFDSFGRGWNVLRTNLGPVVIVVLSRFAVGIVLILPMFISSIICCLWPLLLIVYGAVTTYFSTVWTLAWREWTGSSPEEPPLRMYDAA